MLFIALLSASISGENLEFTVRLLTTWKMALSMLFTVHHVCTHPPTCTHMCLVHTLIHVSGAYADSHTHKLFSELSTSLPLTPAEPRGAAQPLPNSQWEGSLLKGVQGKPQLLFILVWAYSVLSSPKRQWVLEFGPQTLEPASLVCILALWPLPG